jgi:hypothetical protein
VNHPLVAQTWIGTLPAWLTLIALAAASFIFLRSGGSTALGTLEAANRILDRRVHELEEQVKSDAHLIAELKARTDLSVQLQPIVKWTGDHEARDQERFEKTILVLGEIADRLSPDTGAGPKSDTP